MEEVVDTPLNFAGFSEDGINFINPIEETPKKITIHTLQLNGVSFYVFGAYIYYPHVGFSILRYNNRRETNKEEIEIENIEKIYDTFLKKFRKYRLHIHKLKTTLKNVYGKENVSLMHNIKLNKLRLIEDRESDEIFIIVIKIAHTVVKILDEDHGIDINSPINSFDNDNILLKLSIGSSFIIDSLKIDLKFSKYEYTLVEYFLGFIHPHIKTSHDYSEYCNGGSDINFTLNRLSNITLDVEDEVFIFYGVINNFLSQEHSSVYASIAKIYGALLVQSTETQEPKFLSNANVITKTIKGTQEIFKGNVEFTLNKSIYHSIYQTSFKGTFLTDFDIIYKLSKKVKPYVFNYKEEKKILNLIYPNVYVKTFNNKIEYSFNLMFNSLLYV